MVCAGAIPSSAQIRWINAMGHALDSSSNMKVL